MPRWPRGFVQRPSRSSACSRSTVLRICVHRRRAIARSRRSCNAPPRCSTASSRSARSEAAPPHRRRADLGTACGGFFAPQQATGRDDDRLIRQARERPRRHAAARRRGWKRRAGSLYPGRLAADAEPVSSAFAMQSTCVRPRGARRLICVDFVREAPTAYLHRGKGCPHADTGDRA
jgi:hypothetical protein